jgi:hypothetical protein
VEGFDGFSGAAGSIFNVVFVLRAKADEEEFLSGIFCTCTTVKGGNVTEGAEDLPDFILSHIGGQILDENVVVSLSQLIAALRVEFNSDEVLLTLGLLKGLFSVLGVLEANESITTGLV